MKKILLTLTVVIMSLATYASGLANNYYVKNSGETMNFKRIRFVTGNIVVTLNSGEKATIPMDQVKAFNLNGKYFERLPVYTNDQKTDKEVFMEFVATRAGLKLYKYKSDISDVNGKVGFNVNGYKADTYVVFKGDQYWVSVTDKNYPTLFEFFGVNFRES